MPFLLKKTTLFSLIAMIIFTTCNNNISTVMNNSFMFLDNSKITFASNKEAAQLLGTSDSFTKGLSGVDVAARLENVSLNQEQDYLDFAAAQAGQWIAEEISQIRSTLKSAETKMNNLGLNLSLPPEIKIVKSSMKEEGSAGGYTRENYIVLGKSPSEDLIVHELFHIYSRFNPNKRDLLYQTIHFKKCNRIELPAALKKLKVTNPDAPFLEHFLTVEKDGQALEVAFLTLASKEYNGGSFFDYLQKRLLVLEGNAAGKQAKLLNGKPQLLEYKAIENLEELIGNNTGYNIHPEEIMADHFKLLISGQTVPSPELLEAMQNVLK